MSSCTLSSHAFPISALHQERFLRSRTLPGPFNIVPGCSDDQESACNAGDSWPWSLGQEDSLEKRMATHSSILAWSIPWTEEPGRLQSMGSQSQTRVSDWHKKQTPHPGGGCWLLDAYNNIPKTSPSYLNTNQLEGSPQAAPLNPNVASKHHCLKFIRKSGSFELELPVLLTWSL